MMMPVPLMTWRNVDAVAAVRALRTSSAATSESKRRRSLRRVSKYATTASFVASRPNSRTDNANVSPDKIRSTDGMLRSAESPEDGLDLVMGGYCSGGCRLSGVGCQERRDSLHPTAESREPRAVIKQDDELDKLEEDI